MIYGAYETVKRADDWVARLVDNPGQWESGHTEAEALGNLHITMSKAFQHAPDLMDVLDDELRFQRDINRQLGEENEALRRKID